MFAFWLKPFVSSNRVAYMTALTYWVLSTINSHIEMGNILNRIMIIGILVITIFLGWLFDNRKNPIQKTFLCLLFRLISWLSMEIFTEIGFFERDLVFSFDWYNSRTESIVIEFLIWNPLVYALSLLSLYIAIRILQKVYHKK